MSAYIKPVTLALLVFEFSHNVSYSNPIIALHCQRLILCFVTTPYLNLSLD